jgi:hypothetical protein
VAHPLGGTSPSTDALQRQERTTVVRYVFQAFARVSEKAAQRGAPEFYSAERVDLHGHSWRQMEEAAAANLAARAKAEARIETALRANAAILRERRAAFDQKQAFTGQRNL